MPRHRVIGSGRKAKPGFRVKWTLKIRAELASIIEQYFWSELNGKPIYGRRTALVEQLLEEWVEQNIRPQTIAEAPPPDVHPAQPVGEITHA